LELYLQKGKTNVRKTCGRKDQYLDMAEILSGVSGSEDKKAVIDGTFPEMPYEQRILLYEAFDVSQGVGRYKRQFND